MRHIKLIAVTLLAAAAMAAPVHGRPLDSPVRSSTAVDKEAVVASIDRAAEAAIAEGTNVGLQVAVFKNGAAVLVKGYGQADLEQRTPVTDDSVFRIGSVTKQFTAAAIMKLQEEGRLSVEDRLSKYFPDFPGASEITLKQMLQHTSGLHNFTSDATFPKFKLEKHSTAELIAHFASMPKIRDFEPGTSWSYSNTAYCMLSAIVEKVEGEPMATVLQRRFFVPLGMTQTALDDESVIVRGRVQGYAGDGPGKFQNPEFISMSVPVGAGAMRSTATDLARWNAALFGGKVVKPASLAAMTAPGKLTNGQTTGPILRKLHGADKEYGFALETSNVDGHLRIDHGGGIEGFSASLAEFPQDRMTVVVLSNTIGKGVGVGPIADRIQRIALGLRVEQGASAQTPTLSPDSVVERQIEAYNKRDIDAFLATYSDDVVLVGFPDKLMYTGKNEMRTRYAKMFRDSPELNCEVTSKMVLGNTVIYRERVTGRVGGPLEVLAIYSVAGGKITRLEFVRQ